MVCALACVLAGCGGGGAGGGRTPATTRPPKTLTVFSDLSVTGPTGATGAQETVAQQQSIENGARLALEQWGHEVTYGPRGDRRRFQVSFQPLDDANPATGQWTQDLTAANAQRVASDPDAVAYIGDFDSAATAVSLPLLSPRGILQLSPWSPYIGFTDANPADGTGDPGRYYPASGQNDFARLVPSDVAEASAIVQYMSELDVTRLYVLGDVSDFDAAIAQLVANDAPAAGITLVSLRQGLDTQTNSEPLGYAGIATGVAQERPDAILLGGTPDVGAVALWLELHAAMPDAKLFAPSTLATPAFLDGIAAGGGSCATATGTTVPCAPASGATYVTSPILEPDQYPSAARAVLRAYSRRFGVRSPSVYALYGYAAMSDVLHAIQVTGRQIANHQVLLGVFFHHLGMIRGVLGNYTIDGRGDSSLTTFDGYRVSRSGSLRPVRELNAG
jgi:branched-chain amino acid transport system substrate-binding protein